MGNRMTYNGTLSKHWIVSLFLYAFCCCFHLVHAADRVFVNVYLKLNPDNGITEYIKSFNQFWASQKDHAPLIKPYLERHPVHITLYLTHYKKQQLASVLNKARHLAQQEKSLNVRGSKIQMGAGAYIMLGIEKNSALQKLSNRAVFLLKELRDTSAPIPAWAAYDGQRNKLFRFYGSPGVLTLYEPHISIIAAPASLKQQQTLRNQWRKRVIAFNHRNEHPSASINTLAVGLANEEGQIIEELASYRLRT